MTKENTNMAEAINTALKKEGRGKYERLKSEAGGLHDQMNCVYAYMKGYLSEVDSSSSESNTDGKICITNFKARETAKIYQYQTSKTQWQLYSIEQCAKKWGLTYVQIFTLGEFLYSYCPSYAGVSADYVRLENIGKKISNQGAPPMAALNMAKIEKANELLEQARKYLEEAGQTLEIKIK